MESVIDLTVTITSYALTMAVNALVTGLIVFKILKVFLKVRASSSSRSIERTLQSTGSTTTLRYIVFVIIESGMALFASQLLRVVLSILPLRGEFGIMMLAFNTTSRACQAVFLNKYDQPYLKARTVNLTSYKIGKSSNHSPKSSIDLVSQSSNGLPTIFSITESSTLRNSFRDLTSSWSLFPHIQLTNINI